MCLLPGDIRLGSEIYYFMQNIQIACIPLLAARFNLSPKSLLKLFSWAILLQYLALTLQLLAPQLYFSILGQISDPLRPDNSYIWDRNSLVFYGLQRTGNYGTFVAGFGLLALAFRSKRWGANFLIGILVLGSAIVVCLGQARAVFIMCALALIVFVWRGRIIGVKSVAAMPLLASFLAILSVVGLLNVDRIPAIHAFSDPEKEGSNEGKLMIAQYGLDLFKESPIIGWGHRPFSEISSSVGNTLPDTSQTHSQVLAIVLSSGLVGLFAYLALYLKITAALLTRGEYDYSIVCGIFVGLGVYNIVYDAGGLDVFACFNGVAAYYALRANASRTATFPRTWRPT
jgi:O-antigen ligase